MRNNKEDFLRKFQIKDSLLDKIARDFGLKMIVLFGSWAKLSPVPDDMSDIDIAVMGSDIKRFWACADALLEIFPGRTVDLALLEKADPLFRYEIMDQSVLLWGNPDAYCEYRAYAYRDFIDSADLLELEKSLFDKKMDLLAREIYS